MTEEYVYQGIATFAKSNGKTGLRIFTPDEYEKYISATCDNRAIDGHPIIGNLWLNEPTDDPSVAIYILDEMGQQFWGKIFNGWKLTAENEMPNFAYVV